MDPEELFKRFFGMSFPETGDPQFRRGDEDGIRRSDRFHPHGSDVFGDMHLRIQQQMEDMDKQMQEAFRIFTIPDHTPLGEANERGLPQQGCSPRDHMLKEGERTPRPSPPPRVSPPQLFPEGAPQGPSRPSWSSPFSGGFFTPLFEGIFTQVPQDSIPPAERRDQDIDQEVPSKEDIVDMYKKTKESSGEVCQPRRNPSVWSFGSGQSVNVQTVVGADGVVEERVNIRDSSGREERRVTRRLGDRAHTVTTVTDRQGLQERTETFENMDKDQLSEFDRQCQGGGQGVVPPITDPGSALHTPTVSPGGVLSDNRSFFRKLFGF